MLIPLFTPLCFDDYYGRMKLLSSMISTMVAAVMMTMVAVGSDQSESGRDAASTRHFIMLFGARWCAPCMAEYRNLGALVDAAAPDRLVLAWVDGTLPLPPNLANRVDQIPADKADAAARGIGGIGYGLPMAAMADDRSRICAVIKAPLRPDRIAVLREGCRLFAARRRTALP